MKKIKLNPEYKFIDVFVDQGIRGTKEDRPAFQEMLKQCREGQIDLILVKSISRFARSTTIVLEYVRELKLLGAEVHFEKENIQTMAKDGELMLTVLSSFAEEESRSVSENMKWTIRKKFQRGEGYINTKRFLGYDKDEYGDLVINLKEAAIVKRVFEEYLSGKGSHIIAKIFNIQAIPTVAGGKWNDTTILTILKNEKYKGDTLLQKTYTANYLDKKKKINTGQVDSYYTQENHSSIIPDDMWEKVQEELQKRRTWNSGKPSQKVVWQCSQYVKEGKNACEGTVIADDLITELNIKEGTVVKEWVVNGKKHYTYTSKADYSNDQ